MPRPKPNTERHGWQEFHCKNCGCQWGETTRDYLSPSSVGCPHCKADCRPFFEQSDRNLHLTEWGEPIHQLVVHVAGQVPDAGESETES